MSWKSVKTDGSNPRARGAADAGMAEAVVARALVVVAEHGVGLGRFLELLFRGLVARIAIGMVLAARACGTRS